MRLASTETKTVTRPSGEVAWRAGEARSGLVHGPALGFGDVPGESGTLGSGVTLLMGVDGAAWTGTRAESDVDTGAGREGVHATSGKKARMPSWKSDFSMWSTVRSSRRPHFPPTVRPQTPQAARAKLFSAARKKT